MDKHKYRYELAEEILARGGTNEEIQSRILTDFPNSRENPTRAQWYRRSWNKHGHCRGDGFSQKLEFRRGVPERIELMEPSSIKLISPPVVNRQPRPESSIDARSLVRLESEWLDYAWAVLTDTAHIQSCEQNGGTGIEDRSLRWPGYMGELYRPGGLLLVANIHRDFASGRARPELARRLVDCTRTWRDTGRNVASDRKYLTENRACYLEGLQSWTVGGWFAKFLSRAGLRFDDVTYLNAARCQSLAGACQPLQRLCLSRFPLQHLEMILHPKLVLTCSTVVRNETQLTVPIRWFHQRYGYDQNRSPFREWSKLVLAELM